MMMVPKKTGWHVYCATTTATMTTPSHICPFIHVLVVFFFHFVLTNDDSMIYWNMIWDLFLMIMFVCCVVVCFYLVVLAARTGRWCLTDTIHQNQHHLRYLVQHVKREHRLTMSHRIWIMQDAVPNASLQKIHFSIAAVHVCRKTPSVMPFASLTMRYDWYASHIDHNIFVIFAFTFIFISISISSAKKRRRKKYFWFI